jgi:antitoxin (DNA-binding transcriptional repressor) of toxin-antitoxin stability system
VNTVNIHEAKTHLSRLIEEAVKGESFAIAKAGHALVKVSALDTPSAESPRRLGFLLNQFKVPADFDQMGGSDIEVLFSAPKPNPRTSVKPRVDQGKPSKRRA